jgi:malate dehydrogenase
MPNRKKIGLIGAGNIGGELARLCASEELGDVLLFDVSAKENFAKGKALDLEQNGAVVGYDANILGGARGGGRSHHHRGDSAQARTIAR